MFKIEERGLPPFLTYINARLTRQPIVAVLWLIVMLATCGVIYALDSERRRIGSFLMVVAFLYALICLVALASVLVRAEGRRWLFTKCVDPSASAIGAGSKIVVRLLPLLGLAAIVEFWVVRN